VGENHPKFVNVDDEGLPESMGLTDDADASSLTITTTNQPRKHIVTSPGLGGFRGRTVDSVSAVGENHPKFINEGLPESMGLTDDADASSLTITTTNQPREHIVTSPGMGGFRGYHASGLDVEVRIDPLHFCITTNLIPKHLVLITFPLEESKQYDHCSCVVFS